MVDQVKTPTPRDSYSQRLNSVLDTLENTIQDSERIRNMFNHKIGKGELPAT
jgi:hypothetical protein